MNRESLSGDRSFLMIVGALSLIGLMMIFSASGVLAEKRHLDSTYFFKRQLIWLILSVGIFSLVARCDPDRLRVWMAPMALILFVLLSGLLLFGAEINGARRWFRFFGISFQPSEAAKLFTVIYLSHYIAKKGERLQDFFEGLMPALVVVGLEVVLILVEPDLGSAVIILVISFILLFVGGALFWQLALLGLPLVPILIYWVMNAPYRRERLMNYFSSYTDPWAGSFQSLQSYLALGSGGVAGLGLGEGRQKLFFLPELHTDFIFAVIGEELGFLGAMLLLVLFVLLLWGGGKMAQSLDDPFERLLVIGITVLIVLPAMLNVGVVSGLLPDKGLALPFVSYGGSSLLMNWTAVGLLWAVLRKRTLRLKGEVS